ncbi:hypothetical protein G4228_015095 [Cervus hanglu yarkandensis]|nr:hypothetical protein G4228_015095 [Cervus hanglu yarkandensis]
MPQPPRNSLCVSWFSEMPLYFVDLQDDLDDYGFEDYDPDCNGMRVTAFLDVMARGLLAIFLDFSNNEEDFLTVMGIMVRLSEDAEPTVRTELMEQIPPLAIFLQENRSDFPVVLSECLIPVMVRYLTDTDNQVLESSQEVLLMLLEQELIFQHETESKVRATNFGGICHAARQEGPEQFLVSPEFFGLCTDSVWGMRKACAECFLAVAHNTSPEVCSAKLWPLFITLISDPCRWWKVLRTLAFFHELAVILGDQLTAAHLLPVFNGFLKDLDGVQIGVLKHLYDFLKLLHEDKRREYIYQLQEFVVTDNSRNWRFPYELAENCPKKKKKKETVLALQSDQNQDLAFFAALEPKRGNVTDLSMLQEQN